VLENTRFLVDCGSQINVISDKVAARLAKNNPKFKTFYCDPIEIEYGGGSLERSATSATLWVEIQGYRRRIDFYIARISENVILGEPFFNSIHVIDLMWSAGRIGFIDLHSRKPYQWLHASTLSAPEPQQHKVTGKKVFLLTGKLQEFIERNPLAGQISIRKVAFKQDSQKPAKETSKATAPDPDIERLCKSHQSMFEPPTELPPKRPEDMEIILTSDKIPRWRGIGKLNEQELEQLRKQIKEMLERGHIRHSTSPFASNILFVKKPNGGLRMCLDYRGLNDITVKNRAPIPNIQEMRERLNGAKFFTKMDLRDGFYNLRIKEEDIYKTAFHCRYGHFELCVVAMGLSNSPAVFQAMMHRIFSPYIDIFLIVYLDDLIVYLASKEDHLQHLSQIFLTLQKEKLFVKKEKCSFMQTEIEFCGHLVDGTGIRIAEEKAIEMMLNQLS
jgi:Reverse transcriptase (RNA-dependent DNA polymerase)